MKKGKIIAVIGAPRSGKSFLAKLLADYYKGVLILEGEEADFPKRIKEDIEKNIRPVERIIWFRNELIKKYLKAEKLRESGKTVILDTFWISSLPYVRPLLKGFEVKLIMNLLRLDEKIMAWPDVTILLDVSNRKIKDFIIKGGRNFDSSDEFLINQANPINSDHKKIFSQSKYRNKIIKINRDNLDFEKESHFKRVLKIIENNLK